MQGFSLGTIVNHNASESSALPALYTAFGKFYSDSNFICYLANGNRWWRENHIEYGESIGFSPY